MFPLAKTSEVGKKVEFSSTRFTNDDFCIISSFIRADGTGYDQAITKLVQKNEATREQFYHLFDK